MRYGSSELARFVLVLLTALVTLWITTVPAEEKPPAAEDVLDRYVEVTGGKAAYEKIFNRRQKATFELTAQGLKGSLTVWSEKPNRLYSVLEADALGQIERGTDGEVAWEQSMMTGPSIKSGQEKIDMLRDSTFDRWAYWRKVFETVENLGSATVDDKPCDKLSMIPAAGKPQTWYFDRESGLLVRVDMTVESQMGSVTLDSRLLDYREVDGVRIPFEIRINAMGQQRLILTESIEHNIEMPAGRFDLPGEVQALLKKKGS